MPNESPKESPTPWHDWRNDGRELAIVVIGVLIALLLQQLAQDWDWRNKARQAERAMTSELLFADGPQIYQRAAMHPCVQTRLQQIREAVETGRSRGEIARLTDSFWLPVYTYDSNTYQEAIAAGAPGHIPGRMMLRFGIAYSVMPLMDRTNERESVDMARLHSFRGTGEAISDQESIQLLQAVEQLRNDDAIMWQEARLELPLIRQLGSLDAEHMRRLMGKARELYGNCVKPLPADFPNGVPTS